MPASSASAIYFAMATACLPSLPTDAVTWAAARYRGECHHLSHRFANRGRRLPLQPSSSLAPPPSREPELIFEEIDHRNAGGLELLRDEGGLREAG